MKKSLSLILALVMLAGLLPQMILLVVAAEACAQDSGNLVHAIPESNGVRNAIERAHVLTDVTWTPKGNVPGVNLIDGEWCYQEFEAGVTYTGIPYSGVIDADTYVGLNVSLTSFLSAVQDENSVLYTENLFMESYPKKATYFGTVCSKFAQYVLGVPGSYNTANIPNIPGMETIAMPDEYTVDQIRLGDVIVDTSYHTAICTDILYNAGGDVVYIEISEAMPPTVRRLWWSVEDFMAEFANYRLCRYQYIDDVPAVNTEEIPLEYALMPRCGDKYNYSISTSAGMVDILEPGYAKAVILRDDMVVDEIAIDDTTETISFSRSTPGYIEMYLEKEDGTRSGSVYACVVESSAEVTDSTSFFGGKLTVNTTGTSGTPLYVQVGSQHAVFCPMNGRQTAEITFNPSLVASYQVRTAYQNEYGIYLSEWAPFEVDLTAGTGPNPSSDPYLSQGVYWDGYNMTPSSTTPVIQEHKQGYWSYTMIPIEGGATYYSAGATRLWYLDADSTPISTYNAYTDGTVPFQFTAPENAVYVSIAYAPELVEQGMECMEAVMESMSMSLRYDDHLDITGKTVEIVDEGAPTSYKVGYDVDENTVLDTKVVELEGDNLVATGIGTAKVRIDGQFYEVTVTAAPISLLLLAGQSNMQGIDGNPSQSVVCPEGEVYATYADRYQKTVEDMTIFAPSALAGVYSSVNVIGNSEGLEKHPVNMLTEPGDGREGMDSGLAYEWVQQTGEKVWVVNLGYGGSSINGWLEGGVHYEACVDLFSTCQEVLRKEIAAGHYTLSHMGYFWCQGCADETQTAQWYAEKFQTMHKTFKDELRFDHDSNPATPDTAMEFSGIIPIRSGHQGYGSYRAGIYIDSTSVPYYQSFQDLRFNGPRVAQYWMGNNPELTDIWNVCTIQEDWATLPDGSDGVAKCFQSRYENGRVDYVTQEQQVESWYTPTTPAHVHDNIHYNQIGYNEIGRESARNALIMLDEIEAPEAETTVEFMAWDGFTHVDTLADSTVGHSGTLAVPMVHPVWKSKEVTYTVSEGLQYEYYDLLSDSALATGTLTAVGADGSVEVAARELTSYCWSFDGSGLVSDDSDPYAENVLILLAGEISDKTFRSMCYQATQGVRLLHDRTWGVEIQISNWTASNGSMLLSSGPTSTDGQPYLYFRPSDFFVGLGYYDGTYYHNYGVSLKKHDIACSEGTHTYRFVNQVEDDGSNRILLFVDDREIGPLSDHYVNSTLSDTDNDWLSGKDFVMPYLGTTFSPIRDCTINYILACETAYNSVMHIHRWSDWETVTAPGPHGPGIDMRTCNECGQTKEREVEGVWQTHDLDEHQIELPETFCSETNLWAVLEHDKYYYHSGTHWGIHESGSVYSVTIPVSGGEQIYATSFGAYGSNGNTISPGSGIRVTFFDAFGVLKTLTPAETYAEFAANGYLAVPEETVAVNVPMWHNSDSNELYILNREHSYTSSITQPTCTEQGYTTHTCTCGNSYVDSETQATGHDHESVVTAPTCTEGGYTTYTCVCGDVYQENFTDSMGHSFTHYASNNDGTCTADGTKTAMCGHGCGAEDTVTDTGSKKEHAYTDEKDKTCDLCGYVREPVVNPEQIVAMYRLYNPNSGEHFYTGSTEERDVLVSFGWQYEGVAWNAPVQSGDPVYRLFNPNNGDHHYTMSAVERENLVTVGWQYEGVAWNSASADNLPLYRLFNPNADCGSHHYTGSTEERDFLVSLGWIYEGIGWFGRLK